MNKILTQDEIRSLPSYEAKAKARKMNEKLLRDCAPELLQSLKLLVSCVKDAYPDADTLGGLEDAEEAIKRAQGEI